jgi:adenylosuccinate lyase
VAGLGIPLEARMPSGVFDSILLKHMWGTEELRAVFNDENRVQQWYDYEAALALAQAELRIIPRAAAAEIAAKAKVGNVDLEAIAAEIRRTKHPLVPALRALQAICDGEHGEYLHFGPTTQDVLDTGMMLQIKQAHAVFLRDLQAIGRELYRLAEIHKDTPMAGRTHGVQALPITFGHKCAVWLAETGRNYQRLTQLQDRVFVGSLVGAVGTQASFGDHAFELDRKVMARLGLGVADVSWHTARDRPAEYVGVLALIGGGLAKIANEIIVPRTTRSTSSRSRSTKARSARRRCHTSATRRPARRSSRSGGRCATPPRSCTTRWCRSTSAMPRRGGSNGRRCRKHA